MQCLKLVEPLAVDSAVPIAVNRMLSCVPTMVIAAIQTTAIRAASRPYSIIVTPSSSLLAIVEGREKRGKVGPHKRYPGENSPILL